MSSVVVGSAAAARECTRLMRGAAARSGRRWLGVSRYEYPLRKEAPTVSRSLASEVLDNGKKSGGELVSATSKRSSHSQLVREDEVDRFDDTLTLTQGERESLRCEQQTALNTTLHPSHRILSTPPPSIPPPIPPTSRPVPRTLLSTLDNGIRVASQETYGHVSAIGLISNCGSRLESDATTGATHLMELLAFSSTSTHSTSDLIAQIDALGGATFASSSREQFMYCMDILRPNLPAGMDLLSRAVLDPIFTDHEVQDAKKVVEYQYMDLLPEVRIGEGLQIAAYGSIPGSDPVTADLQQLGRPHFCPLEALPDLTSQSIRDFRDANLLNPNEMVIAGAGIQHEELVALAEQYFGHVESSSRSEHSNSPNPACTPIIPSVYTGGEYRLQTPSGSSATDVFTRIAVAFEVGGWHSVTDLVPACVLQILLGGGNSFSAGGPGKGMYSRLYREVLNRYYWSESAEAFTSFHCESGLFGISGSCAPNKARDMTRVIAEHFGSLLHDHVTDEELDRARNMLKCNVLTQLESRLVLFEDIGRQVSTYGKRVGSESMCQKIDAVTKEDIRELIRRAVQKPPTLSTVGEDIGGVPSHDEIAAWFR